MLFFFSTPLSFMKPREKGLHTVFCMSQWLKWFLMSFVHLRQNGVVGNNLRLRLKTVDFLLIPRAWVSFFVQILETDSNQLQFIANQCLWLLAPLNGELIDVGSIITHNIKYMADTSQKNCRNYCIINKLCRLVRVHTHPNNVMIILKALIKTSTIRWL